MTSNIGSHYIQELLDDREEMVKKVNEILKESFRPEFLNRVDEIIIFRPLSKEQLKKIVDIQIDHLRKRLEEKEIKINVSDKVKEYIAELGYDPVYGARPLKRTIQKYIQDPLATQLLKNEFREGDTVFADLDNTGEITFKKDKLKKTGS